MAKRKNYGDAGVKQGEKIVLAGRVETVVVPEVLPKEAKEAAKPDPASAANADVAKQTAIVLAVKEKATGLVVADHASCSVANEMLLQISAARKALEEKRAFFVKPLEEHVKRIKALYTDPLKGLDESDRMLRSKVLTFRAAEQARLDAERKKREAELARKQAEADEAARKAEKAKGKRAEAARETAAQAANAANEAALSVLAAPAPQRVMHAESGQVATRKAWDFEVVDAEKVPRLYLVVDEAALRKAVRSGLRDIPGVRIYEKETLSVGGT